MRCKSVNIYIKNDFFDNLKGGLKTLPYWAMTIFLRLILFKGGISIINVRKMAQAAMFASLMALCAWIALPLPPVSPCGN